MKKLLLLVFLFQSLLMSGKVNFSEYPNCFVGSEVKIKTQLYKDYQQQYRFFFRSFEKGRLSKDFPNGKGIEPYKDLVYTITAVSEEVQYKDYKARVLTLESGSTKLYYFAFFKVLQDRFIFIKDIECAQYIEDSIRTTQAKIDKRIAKNDDPFLGATTYSLTTALEGIDFPSMQNGYISMSKSYKGNEFVCYIVDISLSHVLDEVGPKGLHIIWDNGEHFIKEELPIEKDVVRYTGVGNYFMYSYTAQLVLSQEEYELFCSNKISRVRLGSGIDDTGIFQKNGDFYKYCFNVMKSK